MSVAIDKDGIYIVGAIVALKGCDVGPEIVGWDYENIAIFVSVVGPMTSCAITNCKSRCLVGYKLKSRKNSSNFTVSNPQFFKPIFF
jgi:hypothetical protein